MLTTNKLITQGRGLSRVLLQRATTVELNWNARQKNHFHTADSGGRELSVSLPHGTVLRGGDVLVAEDGSLIAVQAAAQPVMAVTHCAEHGSAFDLARAAYQLGARQVALHMQPDRLKLEPDPALATLLRRMHLTVTDALEVFEPEWPMADASSVAADKPDGHGHGHEHEQSHSHGHQHSATHETAHETAPAIKAIPIRSASLTHASLPHTSTPHASTPHVHGPGCDHDH